MRAGVTSQLRVISQAREFEDVRVRMNERRVLNEMNASKLRKIRFLLPGKVKAPDMKVNCLLQATLDMLPFNDFALSQEREACAARDGRGQHRTDVGPPIASVSAFCTAPHASPGVWPNTCD